MDYATAYAGFIRRLETTRRLQEKINAESDKDPQELDLLFESMFISAFRALENLLEDCFIYSMQGMADLSGVTVPRHANPTNRQHAREMLMGSQTVLDWTTSGAITRRFETFLQDKNVGLYVGVTSGSSTLSTAKDLRNHIAHNSDESAAKYARVVSVFYPTMPLNSPTPGELLRSTPTVGPAKSKQVFTYFREKYIDIARNITAAPA
ncbi:hypothetical protein [Burkholderia gladioli]|uniref:hypothetical protein n=1 Tax=Burkholderia gladioli TaxID=28095 RepID=UPI00164034DD|nr:hypothetical protein [Burkholderia gladioli]